MPVLLYLARHGETAANAQRVFQGQFGAGLNRLGRAQAARLGVRLSKSVRKPTVIVASDLDRAAETATIVGDALGITPIELDQGMREVDVGTWTGKTYEEVARRRGGGETYGELALRIDGAIKAIAERHDDKRILVVSHGGSIKSWISKILGLSGEGVRTLGGVANAGLTVVENDTRGRWRIHAWNDSSHLEGLNADEHSD